MVQTHSIYVEQSKILVELAEKSDCIIVGRCANYVLREFEPLRIFVYAEMRAKMKRCRDKATEQEHLSDKELKQQINGIDKGRASYYRFVAGTKWEDKINYDLCINTTYTTIKQATQIVAQLSHSLSGNDEWAATL